MLFFIPKTSILLPDTVERERTRVNSQRCLQALVATFGKQQNNVSAPVVEVEALFAAVNLAVVGLTVRCCLFTAAHRDP